jgi:pyridoxal phosphate enzyme (YggS family)
LNQIRLLAVSKNFPSSFVIALADCGQHEFGENYVQEGVEKIQEIKKSNPHLELIWHFIGHLQSNKTKVVAQHFDWVQTIDRIQIAQRLNDQRPHNLAPLQVCIQVNIDAGATKSGVPAESALELAEQICSLPMLELRGIMSIPDAKDNVEDQLDDHRRAKALFDNIKSKNLSKRFDTLSMGMSGDLQAAIQAGSTMVRVGTALFGERKSVMSVDQNLGSVG